MVQYVTHYIVVHIWLVDIDINNEQYIFAFSTLPILVKLITDHPVEHCRGSRMSISIVIQ